MDRRIDGDIKLNGQLGGKGPDELFALLVGQLMGKNNQPLAGDGRGFALLRSSGSVPEVVT